MIFSTLALIVGFGVLITSEFVPTIYFGALMSLAMLGGMLRQPRSCCRCCCRGRSRVGCAHRLQDSISRATLTLA